MFFFLALHPAQPVRLEDRPVGVGGELLHLLELKLGLELGLKSRFSSPAAEPIRFRVRELRLRSRIDRVRVRSHLRPDHPFDRGGLRRSSMSR